jgi:pilus assembly protein Flp/PilA
MAVAVHPLRGDELMLAIFHRLAKNDGGATAIEYTMIASLIAVAAIASMRSVGNKVSNVLSNVAGSMS